MLKDRPRNSRVGLLGCLDAIVQNNLGAMYLYCTFMFDIVLLTLDFIQRHVERSEACIVWACSLGFS
jgi:hypothetical protein